MVESIIKLRDKGESSLDEIKSFIEGHTHKEIDDM